MSVKFGIGAIVAGFLFLVFCMIGVTIYLFNEESEKLTELETVGVGRNKEFDSKYFLEKKNKSKEVNYGSSGGGGGEGKLEREEILLAPSSTSQKPSFGLPLKIKKSGDERPKMGQIYSQDEMILNSVKEEVKDEEVEENEEEDNENEEKSEVDELLNLLTTLYTTGVNTSSSDIQGFLRAVNETVSRTSESQLLSTLNSVYTKNSEEFVGRNNYETSVTAFAFMSFGIFLLNQIHSLLNNNNSSLGSSQARASDTIISNFGLSPKNYDAENELQLLFEDPVKNKEEGRELEKSSFNNMGRAFLNLLNAYTEDKDTLNCIWALYCQDLDKTSSQEGLYGIAARINSIGLRLILHQITAELTMDVLMRSLLGWDGLPCTKMFPKCDKNKASGILRNATTISVEEKLIL